MVTGKLPPIVESVTQLPPETAAAIARDHAIARFFSLAESLLRRVEPFIDAAIKQERANVPPPKPEGVRKR